MEPDDDLECVKRELEREFCKVTRKGMDPFGFLHVRHSGRGVEISRKSKTHEQEWWLEFWETDEDEDAPSVGEATVYGKEEAVRVAKQWLSKDIDDVYTAEEDGE